MIEVKIAEYQCFLFTCPVFNMYLFFSLFTMYIKPIFKQKTLFYCSFFIQFL